jgi:hypothetical protein
MIDGSHHGYEENVKLTKQVRRIRARSRRCRRSRTRTAGRYRRCRQRIRRECFLHRSRTGSGFCRAHRLRFSSQSRSEHLTAPSSSTPGVKPQFASISLPMSRKRSSRFPDRSSRRIFRYPGICPDDQPERRQYARCYRLFPKKCFVKPPSMLSARINIDFRYPSCHDRHDPQVLNDNPSHIDPRQYLAPARTAV